MTHLDRLEAISVHILREAYRTDAGQICITAVPAAEAGDLRVREALNHPNDILFVQVGEGAPADLHAAVSLPPDVDADACINATCDLLRERQVILAYDI